MDNKVVLGLFNLIDKYCESTSCDDCIIQDICNETYDEIGIPCNWIDSIERRIAKNERQNK